jgi:hypothetical protein
LLCLHLNSLLSFTNGPVEDRRYLIVRDHWIIGSCPVHAISPEHRQHQILAALRNSGCILPIKPRQRRKFYRFLPETQLLMPLRQLSHALYIGSPNIEGRTTEILPSFFTTLPARRRQAMA